MHAHGIEVLNGAYDDDVVGEIPHDLKLVFLPAEHALFDQTFVHRRQVQAPSQDFHQLFTVIGDAPARSTQRKTWTNEHRESELAGEVETIAKIVDQRGF